jgi:hypothetical protein
MASFLITKTQEVPDAAVCWEDYIVFRFKHMQYFQHETPIPTLEGFFILM